MAITVPPIYTPILDAELDVGTPTNDQTLLKFIRNINFLKQVFPIGQILADAVNIPSAPTPDSTQFQYCDGNEIPDGTSPLGSTGLSTHNTLNLQGYFIRGSTDQFAVGQISTGLIDLTHDHGAVTGPHHQDFDPKGGSDFAGGDDGHTHTIASDLANANPDFPPSGSDTTTQLESFHYNVAFYLRIN